MKKVQHPEVVAHKEAGQRAAAFLEENFGIKLTACQRLELTARFMNTANWQTLLGLTESGLAPRIVYASQSCFKNDDYEVPEGSVVVPTDNSVSSRAKALAAYFGKNGQHDHPLYGYSSYEQASQYGIEPISYWEWVVENLDEDEMAPVWPWESEVDFKISVCKKVGIDIEWDDDVNAWAVIKSPIPEILSPYYGPARDVWYDAYELMDSWYCSQAGGTASSLESLPAGLAAQLVQNEIYRSENPIVSGELSVEERLVSVDVILCKAWGQYILRDAKQDSAGSLEYYWYNEVNLTSTYTSEAKAWKALADSIAADAINRVGQSKWDSMPMHHRVRALYAY